MCAWADYGVSKVGYANGGDFITRAELRENPGSALGGREVWGREQIITALLLGRRLVTMRRSPGGGWSKGEELRLVHVGEDIYIRTDTGEVRGDHLGELPELRAEDVRSGPVRYRL